jgi:hypothetical protein
LQATRALLVLRAARLWVKGQVHYGLAYALRSVEWPPTGRRFRRSIRFARLERERINGPSHLALIATSRCAAPARLRAFADGGASLPATRGWVRTRNKHSSRLRLSKRVLGFGVRASAGRVAAKRIEVPLFDPVREAGGRADNALYHRVLIATLVNPVTLAKTSGSAASLGYSAVFETATHL